MTRAPVLLFAILLAVAAIAFYTWAVGRALDHEARCSTLSGQCGTP